MVRAMIGPCGMVHNVLAIDFFLRIILPCAPQHQVIEVTQRNDCVEDPETQKHTHRHNMVFTFQNLYEQSAEAHALLSHCSLEFFRDTYFLYECNGLQ